MGGAFDGEDLDNNNDVEEEEWNFLSELTSLDQKLVLLALLEQYQFNAAVVSRGNTE